MTISPRPDDNLRRRIVDIERWVEDLQRLIHRTIGAEWQSGLQVRICRTTAGGGIYPESGNTVRVIFLDAEFEPIPGNQPLVSEPRQLPFSVVARTIDGTLPPENTVLPACYIPPMDADKGYWWLITSEGEEPPNLIRFKMTSKLDLAGKGTATEIETGLGYAPVGEEFPIKDPWHEPGSWRDDTEDGQEEGSYMGWCLTPAHPELADGEFEEGAFEDQPFREIIWMEQIATYVNFTATSATTKNQSEPDEPWTITATIDDWYQGKDPADAFASHTIYDPQHLFPYVMECSKGLARYNDKEHRYETVNVNQMAFLATATLGSDLCEDGTATLTGATAASFSPFGMNPDIETAENPHKLCGVAGAQVFLMFNAKWGNECEEAETTTGQWEVIQVEHREISVIIDHRIVEIGSDPTCCQHQIKRINLCAMSCDEIESIEWEIVPGPDDCCQEEPPVGCCGCEPFPMTGTTVLEAEFSGAQEGSGVIPQSDTLPIGVCAKFEGRIDFSSSPCLGITGQNIVVTCFESTGILEVSPVGIGGGICNADLVSIEVNECNPFKATIKYKLWESIFGGCDPCNVDDEITLVLTEKEP